MRDDLTMIYCSPRGGSSLVCGVFSAHGWWTGLEAIPNSGMAKRSEEGLQAYVYRNYENKAIREFIKKKFPLDLAVPEVNPGRADLYAYAKNVVTTKGPWLFKGLTEYYPIFDLWFPEHIAVCVFRKREQAIEAHVRRRGSKVRENATRVVDHRYGYMERLLELQKQPTYRVDADRVVNGDYEQFLPIFERYGIQFDERLASDTISPGNWHQ